MTLPVYDSTDRCCHVPVSAHVDQGSELVQDDVGFVSLSRVGPDGLSERRHDNRCPQPPTRYVTHDEQKA